MRYDIIMLNELFDDPNDYEDEWDTDPSEEELVLQELAEIEREIDPLLRHRPSLEEWDEFADDL
jgi:hypothetical protein